MNRNNFGINWIGPIGDFHGFGIWSEKMALNLKSEGLFVSFLCTTNTNKLNNELIELIGNGRFAKIKNPSIRLGLCLPNEIIQINGSLKIFYTMTEVSPLSHDTVQNMNQCNAIFVPSTWLKNMFCDCGVQTKIFIVPGGVDSQEFSSSILKSSYLPKHRSFRFLSIGKWENRKGFDILIRAFSEAFKPSDDVELVLHTNTLHAPWINCYEEIINYNLPPHPPIRLSTNIIDRSEIPKLIISADTIVLASRGEGFGLPVLEAMACGVPVIVPNHTGLTDFCNHENAFIIECENMVKVEDEIFQNNWPKDSRWHNPSIDSLIKNLRSAYENSSLRQIKSQNALITASKFNWNNSAKKIIDILKNYA